MAEINVDELMTWARAHAPVLGFRPGKVVTPSPFQSKRRVRLEITAEPFPNAPTLAQDIRGERVVARAYLAEPRCMVKDWTNLNEVMHDARRACECGPLAEKRIS